MTCRFNLRYAYMTQGALLSMPLFMQVMSQPVLIVTGASRGIGKAVALAAIQSLNANVLAVARSKDLLEVLKQDVDKCGKGQCLEIVVGDLTDERVVTRAIDRAIDRWGRIDGVVANAGWVNGHLVAWFLLYL